MLRICDVFAQMRPKKLSECLIGSSINFIFVTAIIDGLSAWTFTVLVERNGNLRLAGFWRNYNFIICTSTGTIPPATTHHFVLIIHSCTIA